VRKIPGFIFVLIALSCRSQSIDYRLLRSLNVGEKPAWDATMKGVSFSAFVVSPATPLGIWSHGYFTKDKDLMRNGYRSAATLCVALGMAGSIKYVVNRQRPYDAHPSDITRRDFHNGPYSFPSGHTTMAFASATSLSLTYKKWYVAVPSYVYAGFVGYSRMRLGVHYPSDVLGGVFIGVGCGLLTWGVDEKWLKR